MYKNNLRILVLTIDCWDQSIGANTMSELVSNYNPNNIANIYIREEIPNNKNCNNYFQISEARVIKSIFNCRIKTGKIVSNEESNDVELKIHKRIYSTSKRRFYFFKLIIREILWLCSKWKSRELRDFVVSFNPDIILYPMEGYMHFNKICLYVKKVTRVKSIGYIWDDNFTYKQHNNIGFKVYRFFQRISLKKLAKETNNFFAISPYTKEEADRFFHINSILLTKPLNAIPVFERKEFIFPIKILYTGNLLIGRDSSLIKFINSLKAVNRNNVYFTVEVYTQTQLSEKVLQQLDVPYCVINKSIPQKDVLQKQKEADILLFLEDLDGDDCKVARLSFSTKITDYLSCGKPIIALGNSDTAPIKYFLDNDSAIVMSDNKQIEEGLKKIIDNVEVLNYYAQSACDCGIKNHKKEDILYTFNKTLMDVMINEINTN